MHKPPSRNQTRVLRFIAAHNKDGVPVPRDDVRRSSGADERYLTNTLASLVWRGWLLVPQRGVAAYTITPEGLAACTSEENPS